MGINTSALRNIEQPSKLRRAAKGNQPPALTDIYDEEVNISIWQRQLSNSLLVVVDELLSQNPTLQFSINADPRSIPCQLNELIDKSSLNIPKISLLTQDIANTVNMFCCLFDIERVGLRLTALNKAMCPKFHVDRVPARLISTYQGQATEWLPHHCVDRSKLGAGSLGKSDNVSGIYSHNEDIQQLNTGDVAILKGELWEGNENAGLVHRSPATRDSETRLLLTLDFVAATQH